MAISEKTTRKKYGTFLATLVLSVFTFVLVLGVSAHLTRHSPHKVNVAQTDVDAGVSHTGPTDAGHTVLPLDAGQFDGDAGPDGGRNVTSGVASSDLSSSHGGDDAGATPSDAGRSPQSAAPPVVDIDGLSKDIGRELAGCIESALDEDPSAQVRVRLRLRLQADRLVVDKTAAGTSPYFRRCAERIEVDATVRLETPTWFWVGQSGALSVAIR